MPFNDFEVENAEIQALLRKIAERIGTQMPKGWGFTLLLFQYGETPNRGVFYISSAERESILKVMREFIQRNQ